MHEPIATICAVVPVTVHTVGVSELNSTGRPDPPPVALSVTALSSVTDAGVEPNVIACGMRTTPMVCRIWGAERYVESPGWSAVTVHVPAATRLTTPRVGRRTLGGVALSVMARPDVDVAVAA